MISQCELRLKTNTLFTLVGISSCIYSSFIHHFNVLKKHRHRKSHVSTFVSIKLRISTHRILKPYTGQMFDWCWLSPEIWSVWVFTQTKTSFTQEHRSYWPYRQEKYPAFASATPTKRPSVTPFTQFLKLFHHCKKTWPWPYQYRHCSLIVEIWPVSCHTLSLLSYQRQ